MDSFMRGLTLKDVLHRVVYECKTYSARQLAEGIGCSYSMLCNAANPELDEFRFAARHILPLTNLTQDHRLLNFMEHSCGRVAFSLPQLREGGKERIDALIAENASLFGESLKHVGDAMQRGRVDEIELKRIELALTDQVRTAMALLQALKRNQGAA